MSTSRCVLAPSPASPRPAELTCVPAVCCCGQAPSKGKGFTGVMKRYGFKGGPASHGSSKFHRKPGSIGQTGQGKVHKGQKMAGRHGGKNATVFNLQVYKIDVQRNLVYLLGAVPGPQGGIVRMVDSKKATTNQQLSAMYDLPLPTWLVRSH